MLREDVLISRTSERCYVAGSSNREDMIEIAEKRIDYVVALWETWVAEYEQGKVCWEGHLVFRVQLLIGMML